MVCSKPSHVHTLNTVICMQSVLLLSWSRWCLFVATRTDWIWCSKFLAVTAEQIYTTIVLDSEKALFCLHHYWLCCKLMWQRHADWYAGAPAASQFKPKHECPTVQSAKWQELLQSFHSIASYMALLLCMKETKAQIIPCFETISMSNVDPAHLIKAWVF